MSNHQSKILRLVGVLCCRRGLSPFALRNVLQSFASSSIASCSHSIFLYLKCVTFMNVLRFLCSHILCRIDVLLLPIYTTVPLYNSSYAPASLGDFFAVSSSKLYSLFRVSGIALLTSFRSFYTRDWISGKLAQSMRYLQPCYNITVTAGGLEPPRQLASGCQDRYVCQFHHAVSVENLEGESLPAVTPSKSPSNNNIPNDGHLSIGKTIIDTHKTIIGG